MLADDVAELRNRQVSWEQEPTVNSGHVLAARKGRKGRVLVLLTYERDAVWKLLLDARGLGETFLYRIGG